MIFAHEIYNSEINTGKQSNRIKTSKIAHKQYDSFLAIFCRCSSINLLLFCYFLLFLVKRNNFICIK
jgi:hypothetical protein